MKDRIAKSFFWIVWSGGARQIVSFLSTILVMRLLSPADYGLIALTGIWIIPLGFLAELGLGAGIVQYPSLEDRELNACFWLSTSIAVAGYLGLLVASPAIASWFASPTLSDVLRVAGLSLPLTAVRIVPESLLRKRLELDKVTQAATVGSVVTIPVVVSLAWAGAGVWALVAGAVVLPLAQSVVTIGFARWWPSLRMGRKQIREMLQYSLTTLGSRICWTLYEQADAFVLGKVSGEVLLGSFSMAKQLATLPVERVSAVVNQLTFPVMAEIQVDGASMRDVSLRSVRLVAWVTFPLCAGLMLVAQDFVKLALTEKWMTAVPIIQVLCLYAVIRSVAALLPPILAARYRQNFLFMYNLTLLGVMPLAFWVGAVWLGPMGVAIGWLAVYPIFMLLMAQEALREIQVSWEAIFRQLALPMAVTLMMVATVLAFRWVFFSDENPLSGIRLLVTIVVGSIAYAGYFFAFGGEIKNEILEVLGWLFRRHRTIPAPR